MQEDVRQRIASLLEPYLSDTCPALSTSDATTSPSSSVTALYASRITSLCDHKEAEPFCWACWQAFIVTARTLPKDTSYAEQVARIARLVHLVEAIKHSEPMKDRDDKIVQLCDSKCWTDLPLLGPSMREEWYQRDSQSWLYQNIFAALITNSQVCDFSLYGLWALREALEGNISFCPPAPLESTVPVAAEWILRAGERLISLDKDYGKAGKGGSLWNGESGFCKERWVFWKDRLTETARSDGLAEEIRQKAKEAAERIDELLMQ